MSDIIEVNNQFYILAGSSLADDRSLVLKNGHMFGVFDHYGDIHPYGLGEQGIFHEGTRFLSLLDLRVGRKRPLFLSSIAKPTNEVLSIQLSNPDFHTDDEVLIPRGSIHVARTRFLWEGACHEGIEVTNFALKPVDFDLVLKFDADFVDIFEVRGAKRARRGDRMPAEVVDGALLFGYLGLDKVARKTRIAFNPAPAVSADGTARFALHLEPRVSEKLYVSIECDIDRPMKGRPRYDVALHAVSQEALRLHAETAEVESSRGAFNDSLERGNADVCMMLTNTPHGLYPYAGVPWFSAPFGRDGIVTALQMLWANPSIARGVLSFLAATQAKHTDDAADADPGKIVHEMRRGEMAVLGEVPFRQYYGTVDATPLFVMLAGGYYDRTGDRALIETLWPNIEAAVHWIDRYGDADHDGFVEYRQRSEKGLVHQGWKDSRDAVSHSDGRLAAGPIALCEVQGYAYAAKQAAARLSRSLGDKTRAADLEMEAQTLRERFEETYWCEEKSTYALALDGKKERCDVRSSNSGHCLFTGIASPERAARVTRTLLAESSFSGWGIRTLDSSEVRFNPMSYHNGSVWPHDNAIVAQGFARYEFKQEASRLLSAIFDLSVAVRLNRLPELVCGFQRAEHQGPTLYPVACSPQAWAAGSLYMMLQACLGLQIDAPHRSLRFNHPILPPFIKELHIRKLRVGETLVDLSLHRYPENVGINVDRRTGPLEIMVVK